MTGSRVIQCNMKAFGMQNLRHNLHFQSPTALLQGTTGKGSRISYRAAHRVQSNSRPTPAHRSNPSTCHTLHSTGRPWLFAFKQTNTQRRPKPASALAVVEDVHSWWHDDKQWAVRHQTCTLLSFSCITKTLRSNNFYKYVIKINPPFLSPERIFTAHQTTAAVSHTKPASVVTSGDSSDVQFGDKRYAVYSNAQFQGQHNTVCSRSELQHGSLQCRTVKAEHRGAQRPCRAVPVHTMTSQHRSYWALAPDGCEWATSGPPPFTAGTHRRQG